MSKTQSSEFTPKWMLVLVLTPLMLSVIYYFVGKAIHYSTMSYFEYLQLTSLIAAVVAGGYQLYFWTQRNSHFFKTRVLKIFIDDWFPFRPGWIWIYSFLYYILIGGFIIAIPNMERGIYIIFGGLVLLVIQCILFILFPAVTPPEWRVFEANTISKRYLKFIQGFDGENNCFPSLHNSLAAYISLSLFPLMGYYCLIFVFLIALSTLLTKQHVFVDVIPGIALGGLVYWLIA
jgi:membrane-associated phospholipid phosphatase